MSLDCCGGIVIHADWCWKFDRVMPKLGAWIDDALCARNDIDPMSAGKGYDPDLFKMCNVCPVQRQCAQYAIDAGITDGVWGGLTQSERRRVKLGAITLNEVISA